MEVTPYRAYCSARDQPVLVVRKSDVLGGPRTGGDDRDPSDVVCLSYGRKCTGAVCPVFQVPKGDMAKRLQALGLLPRDRA